MERGGGVEKISVARLSSKRPRYPYPTLGTRRLAAIRSMSHWVRVGGERVGSFLVVIADIDAFCRSIVVGVITSEVPLPLLRTIRWNISISQLMNFLACSNHFRRRRGNRGIASAVQPKGGIANTCACFGRRFAYSRRYL